MNLFQRRAKIGPVIKKIHSLCSLAWYIIELCNCSFKSTVFMVVIKILRHLHYFLNLPRKFASDYSLGISCVSADCWMMDDL